MVRVTKWRSSRMAAGVRAALLTGARKSEPVEVAHVKLDESGKTVRVMLADCEVI